VLAVSCFAVSMAESLGVAKVGLAFSNTIQLLVFYTWTVRFIAETLFSMSAVEKLVSRQCLMYTSLSVAAEKLVGSQCMLWRSW